MQAAWFRSLNVRNEPPPPDSGTSVQISDEKSLKALSRVAPDGWFQFGGVVLARSVPLLASPRGGVAASSTKCRAATEATQPGWCSLSRAIGKPPRPREKRTLRDIFLIARPPLLAVVQGGESASLKLAANLDSCARKRGQRFPQCVCDR